MINEFKVIVSAVILNGEGKVLLAKRSMDEEVFPGLWGIPGGTVELTENMSNVIEQTLAREIMEEVGIEVEVQDYLESTAKVKGDKAKIYIIFKAMYKSGNPAALDGTEVVKWWNFEDIRESTLTPGTYTNISQVCLRNDERVASL